MKEKVLEILKNTNDFTSGQSISTILGVSRNSVWKYINSLKNEGYVIEGVSKKGYRLIKSPDIPTTLSLKELLKTNFIGCKIYNFDDINSTNTKAKELAMQNEPDGTIIISQTQNSGSGRFNRVWSSPKGGIWTSIILRPNIDPSSAHKITLIAAASLFKTITSLGLTPKIKWPNDIYINNKKCAGILTTMNSDMDKINYIILGIGLNVNIEQDHFKNELINGTSLSIELNKSLNLTEIFSSIINNFEPLYEKFILDDDIREVIKLTKENSLILNKPAKLVTVRGSEDVTPIEIDDSGELIVRLSDGSIKKVISGEITFHC